MRPRGPAECFAGVFKWDGCTHEGGAGREEQAVMMATGQDRAGKGGGRDGTSVGHVRHVFGPEVAGLIDGWHWQARAG